MILSPRSPSVPLQLRGFCANQKCVKITKEGERRSYGINEQRTRDIIQSPSLSLSHLSLCTHTPPLLLSAFVSSSSQFPRKLCFPFFHPLLSFSPCLSLPSFSSHKFLDYLVFYLQFPPLLSFPPLPPPRPSAVPALHQAAVFWLAWLEAWHCATLGVSQQPSPIRLPTQPLGP